MKYLIPSALVSILLFTSFAESEPSDSDSQDSVQFASNFASSDCVTDNAVSYQGAEFWKKSWAHFIEIQGDSSFSPSVDLNPIKDVKYFDVDIKQLNKLLEKCESCGGLRIYFGGADKDLDFNVELLFQNIKDCDDVIGEDDEKPFLMTSSSNGKFVSKSTATSYVNGWIDHFTDIEKDHHAFAKVYAYNFSRERIESVMNEQKDENNETDDKVIRFHLGMHTLTPAGTSDYEDEVNGAIIPITGTSEGGRTIYGQLVPNIIVQNPQVNGEEKSNLDFANPCPKFCGTKRFWEEQN